MTHADSYRSPTSEEDSFAKWVHYFFIDFLTGLGQTIEEESANLFTREVFFLSLNIYYLKEHISEQNHY